MPDRSSPDYRSLMITSGLLIVAGWSGLYLLVITTLPTVGPRWLFFFLLTLAATGTALPFLWLLHRRFPARRAATSQVLLRQALWFAFFTALCTWLQINRALNLPLALLLAAGFVVLEWFVRLLDRSLWSPRR
ncbi:MAG TPA: hypothetical protein VGA07_06410 [Anaerolineales bacterium]|jgi:hypothetical protein